MAAEAFLENDDACVVDSEKKEVRLSQIFKWYKADFGGTDEKVRMDIGWLFNTWQQGDYIFIISPLYMPFLFCSCCSGLSSTWATPQRRPACRGSFLLGRLKSASSHMTGAAIVAIEHSAHDLSLHLCTFTQLRFLKKNCKPMFNPQIFMQNLLFDDRWRSN